MAVPLSDSTRSGIIPLEIENEMGGARVSDETLVGMVVINWATPLHPLVLTGYPELDCHPPQGNAVFDCGHDVL